MKGRKNRKVRGIGQIIERSPGRFGIRLYVGTDSTGMRHYHSETYHGGITGAKTRLRELIAKRQSGEPLKLGNDTLDAFLDEWLAAIKPTVKERSHTHYAKIADLYIRPKLGKLMLTRIETSTIEGAYRQMEGQGLASSTVGYVHGILKAVFKTAIERGRIVRNPMTAIKLRSTAKATRENAAMTAEEVARFLDAAEGTRFETFLRLAFHTGCRPGELLALKWADLDQAARTLAIRRTIVWRSPTDWYLTTPKTAHSNRTIPIAESIVERLQAHRRAQLEDKMRAGKAWRSEDFVFADEVGGPYSQTALHATFKRILRAAGLAGDFTPYTTRHTAATLLMGAGMNPKIVAERLGHADVSLTLRVYSHVQAGMQAAATAELDRLIPAKRG